ncbi:hypothetical protein QFZ63_003657 [Streptomyces sp. B3I7]|nr:hypothetical protein [Streptomyces sp. B3I7]
MTCGSEELPAAPDSSADPGTPAASRVAADAAPSVAPPRRSPRHSEAVTLLARLRRIDDRLVLFLRDVDRLADAAVPWLDCGLSSTGGLRSRYGVAIAETEGCATPKGAAGVPRPTSRR